MWGHDVFDFCPHFDHHTIYIIILREVCFKQTSIIVNTIYPFIRILHAQVAAFEFKKQNSDQIAGDEIVCCRIGIGICYDMRFAEMAQVSILAHDSTSLNMSCPS